MKAPAPATSTYTSHEPPGTVHAVHGDAALAPMTGRDRGVTPRVVLLSLALAVVFGYALPVIDYKFYNTFLGGSHLPVGAVAMLLVIVLVVNPVLKSIRKGWGFSRNETLTLYISCLFSSLVPGHGSENFLIPNLITPFYFATRENKWLSFFGPYLKPWITPALNGDGTINHAVADGWYQGLSTGQQIPWGAWITPLCFWIPFVLVSYAMLGCLSVMLRAQWGEHEALAFPLLRLPLTITEDMDRADKYGKLGRFFRSPLMWAGFGIAVFMRGLSGLHLYFPDVPDFPLGVDMGPLLSEPPWNQFGWVPLNIYPLVVGVTYLLTSEISFSIWFFYWFIKFQYVAAYLIGFPPGTLPNAQGLPDKLFTGNQMGGCYIAYVAIVLWTGREHFAHVFRRATGRAKATPAEATEVLSYPLAFWGFVLSFAFMVAATTASGVRWDIALALWLSYLVLAIGLTRVAVEGGMLALQHHTNPLGAIAKLVNSGPSGWLTMENGVSSVAFFQAGMVNHMRGFIMPSFVQGFKLAHDNRISARPLAALVSAVVLISVGVSWWTVIRLGYTSSALTFGHTWWAQSGPRMPADFTNDMTTSTSGSAPQSWLWLSVGAALTYGMMLARSRFTFFPFHPIGYMMALTYPSATFWFSIFLGWMFKTLISRFGGTDTYRNTIPAFLGLALGDVFMILLWLVVDGWQGRTGHLLLPG